MDPIDGGSSQTVHFQREGLALEDNPLFLTEKKLNSGLARHRRSKNPDLGQHWHTIDQESHLPQVEKKRARKEEKKEIE